MPIWKKEGICYADAQDGGGFGKSDAGLGKTGYGDGIKLSLTDLVGIA